MKKFDRILGAFLAIAMVFTIMPMETIYASGEVPFSGESESEDTVLFEEDFEDLVLKIENDFNFNLGRLNIEE